MDIEKYRDNPKTSYLFREYDRFVKEINETKELISADPNMAEIAGDEIKSLEASRDAIIKNIEDIAVEEIKAEEDPKEVILEVRAGAGGEEAAIFASELAEMYEKYAEMKGWSWKPVDVSEAELGGFKEATFEVKGKPARPDASGHSGGGVYSSLKYEMGVHRVQRVPATEKQGRVHTSTASVAVMPIRPNKKV